MSQEPKKLKLAETAQKCKTFEEFHALTQAQQPPTPKVTLEFQDSNFKEDTTQQPNRNYNPTRKRKNLQQIAHESMTFSDFHQRTTENEDEV